MCVYFFTSYFLYFVFFIFFILYFLSFVEISKFVYYTYAFYCHDDTKSRIYLRIFDVRLEAFGTNNNTTNATLSTHVLHRIRRSVSKQSFPHANSNSSPISFDFFSVCSRPSTSNTAWGPPGRLNLTASYSSRKPVISSCFLAFLTTTFRGRLIACVIRRCFVNGRSCSRSSAKSAYKREWLRPAMARLLGRLLAREVGCRGRLRRARVRLESTSNGKRPRRRVFARTLLS